MIDIDEFRNALLTWYDAHARILPWRSHPTPYRVWISEMMLQQTRVETVIPYFLKFVDRLPDVASLAKIDEDSLLKLWQGLGYYSRALNLKKAALVIMEQYQGEIPSDSVTLQKLPGIGPYSAGAISSIAFGKQEVLMDGSVLRVMARLHGIFEDVGNKATQKQIHCLLEQRIPESRPGDFNQALMELGATCCIPNGAPLCQQCPVCSMCEAFREGLTGVIPVKSKKKLRTTVLHTVVLLRHEGRYGVEKRSSGGLLGKMWGFPMFNGHITAEMCRDLLYELGYQTERIESLPRANHVFTHVEWNMIGYEIEVTHIPAESPYRWETISHLRNQYAIPSAYSYFINHL